MSLTSFCVWLNLQEDTYRFVVYQCDPEMSAWTQRCIRQADCILLVVNGFKKPETDPFDGQLQSLSGVRAQKKLVLLWRQGTQQPRGTTEWLDVLGWVSSHYHVRCPVRVFSKKSSSRLLELYERVYSQPVDKFSDFARLARILSGQSIGLVLGGGGARGAAHLGVIRAMREYGIPIDMVGGTSIGAFMAGLLADSLDVSCCIARAKSWFAVSFVFGKEMCYYWNKIWDLTYPVTAIFTGYKFNDTISSLYETDLIEDLWLPYFTVTTDITASQQRVHTSGPLWLYVRGSMTIAGVFPPMCDPVDGHYLVDGCYVNNVPADVMRSQGARSVISVDVGAEDDDDLTNYGTHLSGWWVMWHRWNPWAKPVKVLSMAEVQSKLAYVSCIRQLEHIKRAPYCYYVRPPIDQYQTMDFHRFDEIFAVGYQHAKALLDVWLKSGKLREIVNPDRSGSSPGFVPFVRSSNKHKTLAAFTSSPSFTDLAALVSEVRKPQPVAQISDDDSTDYDSEENDCYESDYGENVGLRIRRISEPNRMLPRRDSI